MLCVLKPAPPGTILQPAQGNRHYFLLLIWFNIYAAAASAIIGIVQIQRYVNSDHVRPGPMVWMVSFEVINVFVGVALTGLGCAQASQVARNITTNELANWHRWEADGRALAHPCFIVVALILLLRDVNAVRRRRYQYLQATDGKFVNPFNGSMTDNCIEACTPSSTPMAPVYLPKSQGKGKQHSCNSGCRH